MTSKYQKKDAEKAGTEKKPFRSALTNNRRTVAPKAPVTTGPTAPGKKLPENDTPPKSTPVKRPPLNKPNNKPQRLVPQQKQNTTQNSPSPSSPGRQNTTQNKVETKRNPYKPPTKAAPENKATAVVKTEETTVKEDPQTPEVPAPLVQESPSSIEQSAPPEDSDNKDLEGNLSEKDTPEVTNLANSNSFFETILEPRHFESNSGVGSSLLYNSDLLLKNAQPVPSPSINMLLKIVENEKTIVKSDSCPANEAKARLIERLEHYRKTNDTQLRQDEGEMLVVYDPEESEIPNFSNKIKSCEIPCSQKGKDDKRINSTPDEKQLEHLAGDGTNTHSSDHKVRENEITTSDVDYREMKQTQNTRKLDCEIKENNFKLTHENVCDDQINRNQKTRNVKRRGVSKTQNVSRQQKRELTIRKSNTLNKFHSQESYFKYLTKRRKKKRQALTAYKSWHFLTPNYFEFDAKKKYSSILKASHPSGVFREQNISNKRLLSKEHCYTKGRTSNELSTVHKERSTLVNERAHPSIYQSKGIVTVCKKKLTRGDSYEAIIEGESNTVLSLQKKIFHELIEVMKSDYRLLSFTESTSKYKMAEEIYESEKPPVTSTNYGTGINDITVAQCHVSDNNIAFKELRSCLEKHYTKAETDENVTFSEFDNPVYIDIIRNLSYSVAKAFTKIVNSNDCFNSNVIADDPQVDCYVKNFIDTISQSGGNSSNLELEQFNYSINNFNKRFTEMHQETPLVKLNNELQYIYEGSRGDRGESMANRNVQNSTCKGQIQEIYSNVLPEEMNDFVAASALMGSSREEMNKKNREYALSLAKNKCSPEMSTSCSVDSSPWSERESHLRFCEKYPRTEDTTESQSQSSLRDGNPGLQPNLSTSDVDNAKEVVVPDLISEKAILTKLELRHTISKDSFPPEEDQKVKLVSYEENLNDNIHRDPSGPGSSAKRGKLKSTQVRENSTTDEQKHVTANVMNLPEYQRNSHSNQFGTESSGTSGRQTKFDRRKQTTNTAVKSENFPTNRQPRKLCIAKMASISLINKCSEANFNHKFLPNAVSEDYTDSIKPNKSVRKYARKVNREYYKERKISARSLNIRKKQPRQRYDPRRGELKIQLERVKRRSIGRKDNAKLETIMRAVSRGLNQHLQNIYDAVYHDAEDTCSLKSAKYLSIYLRTASNSSKDAVLTNWEQVCHYNKSKRKIPRGKLKEKTNAQKSSFWTSLAKKALGLFQGKSKFQRKK